MYVIVKFWYFFLFSLGLLCYKYIIINSDSECSRKIMDCDICSVEGDGGCWFYILDRLDKGRK